METKESYCGITFERNGRIRHCAAYAPKAFPAAMIVNRARGIMPKSGNDTNSNFNTKLLT